MAPNNVHILIPRPGECVTSRGKGDFVDVIQLRTEVGDDPGDPAPAPGPFQTGRGQRVVSILSLAH